MKNTKRNIFREVQFRLTQHEIVSKGKQVAELQAKITEKEVLFAAERKAHTITVKEMVSEKLHELKLIRQGYEERVVECVEERDYSQGLITYWYDSAVVHERPMTSEERQVEMEYSHTRKAEKPVDDSVSSVIREETSKKTKLSAVDGPA